MARTAWILLGLAAARSAIGAFIEVGGVKPLLPSPMTDWKACGQDGPSSICDPLGFLRKYDADAYASLQPQIDALKASALVSCGAPTPDRKGGIEAAVAVVDSMHLGINPKEQDIDRLVNRAAKAHAERLHNAWGVGDPSCGHNGMLIFLSIEDRAVFLSRGSALDASLGDRRLDRIVTDMKPLCRHKDYASAVALALRQAQGYVAKGPPSWFESIGGLVADLFPAGIFIGIVGCFAYHAHQKRRRTREYHEAARHLTRLERDRAEARAGHYNQTTCAICLEPFRDPGPAAADESKGDDGTGDGPGDASPLLGQPGGFARIGSDGKPCRMLRCGHLFDETCFQAWVDTNPSAALRCPICREDNTGQGPDTGSSGPSGSSGSSRPPGTLGSLGQPPAQDCNRRNVRNAYRPRRNWAAYEPELAFRLHRLRQRYPAYIDQNAVDRWRRQDHNGGFAADPSFVAHAPRPAEGTGRTGGGGGRSFGGGRSSGGSGGRW